MMSANLFDSTAAAAKCAPAQIRELAQLAAVAARLGKRSALPPGAFCRPHWACCPIPKLAGGAEIESRLKGCMYADERYTIGPARSGKAAASTPAPTKQSVACPDGYSGNGGVSTSGVQVASAPSAWMAVIGRQKEYFAFSCQVRMAESASAAVNSAMIRASAWIPPGGRRAPSSRTARLTKPRCEDW